jgi:hypothetical protein
MVKALCSICGQPDVATCPRCGNRLCAGCKPPPNRRCYRCESAFNDRTRRPWIRALDALVLVPVLTAIIAVAYHFVIHLEHQPGGNKSATFLIFTIIPLVGIPWLWLIVRTRVQRARFLREHL